MITIFLQYIENDIIVKRYSEGWTEVIMKNINTSSDVGGQGDKLTETLPLEVLAELVLLMGTIVYVPDHHGVPRRVDKVPQMVGRSVQWLLLGSVYGNNVKVPHLYLDHLDIGLSKFSDPSDFQLPLDIYRQPLSAPNTHKVTIESFQLVLLILFFSVLQPGLLKAQNIALHQDRVAFHVLDMLAEGESVEGAHFQTQRCWVHPQAGILVH